MKNRPLVTVGMPAYNHERFIREAIVSLIEQEYENIELIIINDGSTDGTENIIKDLEDDCLNRFINFIYISQENEGVSSTLNKILNLSSGEYICFSASDDTQPNNRISCMVNFLIKHKDYDFCFAGYNNINSANSIFLTVKPTKDFDLDFEEILLKTNEYAYFNYMANIEVFKNLGGFKKNIKIEDWELALRVAFSKYKAKFIAEILYNHRFHGENTSFNYEYMKQGRLDILEQYKRHPKYNEAVEFWIDHYNRLYYYKFLNKFYSRIEAYNKENLNIIIYGNGNIGKIIASLILNSNFCFVDQSSCNDFKIFKKGEVYSKKSLFSIDFDYIIISPFYLNDNISYDLEINYNIPLAKIVKI